jgi:hypothetical protein
MADEVSWEITDLLISSMRAKILKGKSRTSLPWSINVTFLGLVGHRSPSASGRFI